MQKPKKYYGYWTKEQLWAFVDFFRWKEIGIIYIPTIIIYHFSGWWALGYYIFIQLLENVGGGTLIGYYEEEPTREPCSAGIEDCPICGNGYKHEWNVERRQVLKWYEKCL